MPVACVTIRDLDGRPFVHVTEAKTLFSAVAEAIAWFDDDFWHGQHGLSPDEIVSRVPSITFADVHAALAYCYDHREDV